MDGLTLDGLTLDGLTLDGLTLYGCVLFLRTFPVQIFFNEIKCCSRKVTLCRFKQGQNIWLATKTNG